MSAALGERAFEQIAALVKHLNGKLQVLNVSVSHGGSALCGCKKRPPARVAMARHFFLCGVSQPNICKPISI
jgi:hypothetical protein